MNYIQSKYMILHSIWERALLNKKFALVKEVEAEFIEAEEALIRWALANYEVGGMSKEDAAVFRANWHTKSALILELAMRLHV